MITESDRWKIKLNKLKDLRDLAQRALDEHVRKSAERRLRKLEKELGIKTERV